MKIGVAAFCTEETLSPAQLAVELEQRGFESLFITDHTHIPMSRVSDYPDVYGGGELPEFYKRTHDVFVGPQLRGRGDVDAQRGERHLPRRPARPDRDGQGSRLTGRAVGRSPRRLRRGIRLESRRARGTRDGLQAPARGDARPRCGHAPAVDRGGRELRGRARPARSELGLAEAHEPAADLPRRRRADDDAARGRVGRRVVPRQPHRRPDDGEHVSEVLVDRRRGRTRSQHDRHRVRRRSGRPSRARPAQRTGRRARDPVARSPGARRRSCATSTRSPSCCPSLPDARASRLSQADRRRP